MIFRLKASVVQSNIKCKLESLTIWAHPEPSLRDSSFGCFRMCLRDLLIVVCLQTLVWDYMQSYSIQSATTPLPFIYSTHVKTGGRKASRQFGLFTNLSSKNESHCCTELVLGGQGDFHCILFAAMIVRVL